MRSTCSGFICLRNNYWKRSFGSIVSLFVFTFVGAGTHARETQKDALQSWQPQNDRRFFFFVPIRKKLTLIFGSFILKYLKLFWWRLRQSELVFECTKKKRREKKSTVVKSVKNRIWSFYCQQIFRLHKNLSFLKHPWTTCHRLSFQHSFFLLLF